MNYVVIFAGGVGERMGSDIPKQFLTVGEKPIIIHVLEKFSAHEDIDGIVVVCKEEYISECGKFIDQYHVAKILNVIPGGETGQLSIRNGVRYLAEEISRDISKDIVLIHDGVRPLITTELITKSIQCTKENGNSIASSSAIETVIIINEDGSISTIEDRSRCRNAKAPQCFRLQDIWNGHQLAQQENRVDFIDSAMLMAHYGYTLFTTECGPENIKITTPNDYYMFQGMFENNRVDD